MMRGRQGLRGAPDEDAIRAKVHRATEMLVAIHRRFGKGDEAVRADVLADVRQALTGAEPRIGLLQAEDAADPEPAISTPGVYRLILDHFGLDRSDVYLQEAWTEWVQRTLAEALAETDGDFRRRGE